MRELFWSFTLYSFCGFLLEVAFARLVGHPKRDRKCLLLLPLCPVYGAGGVIILILSRLGSGVVWVMGVGFLAATASELLFGAFYRYILGVEFWDYRHLPWNLGGLVCLEFSLYWAGLALVLVYVLHPWVAQVIALIPPGWTAPAAIVLLSDLLVSSLALARAKTTDILQWYRGKG